MAKSPKKRSVKSNKKPKQSNKKPCDCPDKATALGDPPETTTVDACSPCADLATGKWGIVWRDAAGTCRCLEGPAADKVLRGDANGPYWSNA